MYSGIFILKDVLPEPLFTNFKSLNIALRLLASSRTVYTINDYAEQLLKYFFDSFSVIYGKFHITYNIHSILHLAKDAMMYGEIEKFSAFVFENYLQHLKRIVNSGPNPLKQLYNRIVEERSLT